jgi:membrane associated rhomboid family serine protease
MIPISDNNPRRRVPVVTLLIILVNVLVWLYEVSLPAPALNQFFASLALIPLRITNAPNAGAIFTLFSSMFMHAGWLHIIGNMLYLWIFGDNVEDRLGRGLFLLFYLAGGVLAALAQVAFAPGSQVPILGASGAIAAVLGAYLVLFPHQRVRNLVIIFFFIRTVELPAIVVLGLWFILQILSGITAITTTASGGTAWFAHIGGFVFGLLVGALARQLDREKSSPYFIPR